MVKRLNPDEDLDGLIRQLNTAAREAIETPSSSPSTADADDSTVVERESTIRWALPRAEPEGDEWLGRLSACPHPVSGPELQAIRH